MMDDQKKSTQKIIRKIINSSKTIIIDIICGYNYEKNLEVLKDNIKIIDNLIKKKCELEFYYSLKFCIFDIIEIVEIFYHLIKTNNLNLKTKTCDISFKSAMKEVLIDIVEIEQHFNYFEID